MTCYLCGFEIVATPSHGEYVHVHCGNCGHGEYRYAA